MDKNEKLADRLGQIIFRLEMNTNGLKRPMPAMMQMSYMRSIDEDLEKLKELKTELLGLCVVDREELKLLQQGGQP